MTPPPTIHHLKCWPAFFAPTAAGQKTFELRLDDRGFQTGDILLLHRTREDDQDAIEWSSYNTDGTPAQGATPAATITRRVSYALHGPKFGLAPGYVILALQTLSPAELVDLNRAEGTE